MAQNLLARKKYTRSAKRAPSAQPWNKTTNIENIMNKWPYIDDQKNNASCVKKSIKTAKIYGSNGWQKRNGRRAKSVNKPRPFPS